MPASCRCACLGVVRSLTPAMVRVSRTMAGVPPRKRLMNIYLVGADELNRYPTLKGHHTLAMVGGRGGRIPWRSNATEVECHGGNTRTPTALKGHHTLAMVAGHGYHGYHGYNE